MSGFLGSFNIVQISTPLIVYLILMILLKIFLGKISFIEKGPLKNFFEAIKAVLHVLIFIIIFIVSLSIFGVDVQGIVAGLGLMSFAIGMVLKDTVGHFISGFFILMYKPFNIGDEVTIDGIKGRVKKIDIRYTTIEDGTDLNLIPNSSIIGTKIKIKK